jgi:peroxiredoxin
LKARGFRSLVVTVAVTLGLLVVFLFALQAPGPAPAPTATPLKDVLSPGRPSGAEPATVIADAVASVDGDPISRVEWQKAVAIDRAMSQLAGQTAPNAEVTLDRLINQRLVLRQAGNKISASDANATERLASLQQNWRADDAAVDRALASVNLSRQDLLAEIKRLLVVESYLKQMQDAAGWLAAQRAQAQVGVLTELAAPPVTPTLAAQTAAPTLAAQVITTPTPIKNIPLGIAPGQLAFDFTLDDVSGQRIKLSDLRGRPVVINFWATWCPPCRQELPALQSAYQRFRDQGVVLLGVNLKENVETIQNFTTQFGLTYPLLLDRDGAVSERYQVRGIPTTVIVDADGVVRARHVGPLTEDKFAEYVSPLLAAPTPIPTATAAAKVAPDFSLPRENGQAVRLSAYRDKSSIVLVFYRGQT